MRATHGRRRRRDEGHLLVLEGIVVAAILLGAVLFFLEGHESPRPASTRDDMRRVLDDAVRIFAGLPVADERYGDRFLDKAVANAVAGNATDLESKLARMLPPAAAFNVVLDNGADTREILKKRDPVGERVSSSTSFVPAWSPLFAITDFELHADAGTPMTVRAFPVLRGALVNDDPLVGNGEFETDADGDGVPDAWAVDADPDVSAAVVTDDGENVWEFTRSDGGTRLAYASNPVKVDAGSGIAVYARIRGDPACVQVRYLDADLQEIDVDGAPAHCIASLGAASVGFADVGGTRVLGSSAALAYVRIELALDATGTAAFDDVEVRPTAVAALGANDVHLERSAANTYTAYTSQYETAAATHDALLEMRHRHVSIASDRAYRVEINPLLAYQWDEAQQGLNDSSLTLSGTAASVGSTLRITYDFTQYEAALDAVGVALTSPTVRVRIYEPVLDPATSGPVLAKTFELGADLAHTVDYEVPATALYGPTLVVASVDSGLTANGYVSIGSQVARKAVVFDTTLRDGSVAAPPVYRVAVETWFPEWS